jgi:hypothetical protein
VFFDLFFCKINGVLRLLRKGGGLFHLEKCSAAASCWLLAAGCWLSGYRGEALM